MGASSARRIPPKCLTTCWFFGIMLLHYTIVVSCPIGSLRSSVFSPVCPVIAIDRDSPIPIYHQLKALIQGQIDHGVWQPGDRIPTEQELCQRYGISRSPVRQALSELASEGLLVRRSGLGTFVANPAPSGASLGTLARVGAPIQVMSSDLYWSQVLDRVAAAWNVEHPDRRVAFDVNVVEHNQFHSLLSAAIGSGAAPDVAMVDCVWVAGLARSGFLYALEADQDGRDPTGRASDVDSQWNCADLKADLYPAFIEANSFDAKLYGLPLKADVSLLWYRKDWFAKEGLEPPQDWNDLLDVARHFLQPSVRGRYDLLCPVAFPAGTTSGEATVYTLMPFVWSAGGRVFDGETVVLDAPATRRALQFLRELVTLHRVSEPDVVNYKSDTVPWLFGSARVAMAFGGSYETGVILDTAGWAKEEFMERVGCVALPAAPGSSPVSTVGGTSYVILRQCRRPALVMDVLKTAINPEVIGDLYCSMLQDSPCRSFESLLNPETEPLLALVPQMIVSGRARSPIPEYFRVSRQLQAMVEAAIAEPTPIDEIVRRTADYVGVISGRRVYHRTHG